MCQREILLFDHGKVRASSDRRHRPPLRPLLVACGYGAVHGDEIEVAADVYELV